MNKKFLSAILFGALAVASTGSFVSCKDYDDDIDNLQSQINQLATKSDLQSQVSTLESSLASAKSSAESAVSTAQKAVEEAKAAADKAAAAQGAAGDAQAAANAAADAVKAAEAKLEAAEKKLADIEAELAAVKSLKADLEAYTENEVAKLQKEIAAEIEKFKEEAKGLVGLHYVDLMISNAYPVSHVFIDFATFKPSQSSNSDYKKVLLPKFPELAELEKTQIVTTDNMSLLVSPAVAEMKPEYTYELINTKEEALPVSVANPQQGLTRASGSEYWTLDVEAINGKDGKIEEFSSEAALRVSEGEEVLYKTAVSWTATVADAQSAGVKVWTKGLELYTTPVDFVKNITPEQLAALVDTKEYASSIELVKTDKPVFTVKNGYKDYYVIEVSEVNDATFNIEKYGVSVEGSKLLIKKMPENLNLFQVKLKMYALGLNGSTDMAEVILTISKSVDATVELPAQTIEIGKAETYNLFYSVDSLGLTPSQLYDLFVGTGKTVKAYVYNEKNEKIDNISLTNTYSWFKADKKTAATAAKDAKFIKVTVDGVNYVEGDYTVVIEATSGAAVTFKAAGELTAVNTDAVIRLVKALCDENGVLQAVGNLELNSEGKPTGKIYYEIDKALVLEKAQLIPGSDPAVEGGIAVLVDNDATEEEDWVVAYGEVEKYKSTRIQINKNNDDNNHVNNTVRNMTVHYFVGNVKNVFSFDFQVKMISAVYSEKPADVIKIANQTIYFTTSKDRANKFDLSSDKVTTAIFAAGTQAGKAYNLFNSYTKAEEAEAGDKLPNYSEPKTTSFDVYVWTESENAWVKGTQTGLLSTKDGELVAFPVSLLKENELIDANQAFYAEASEFYLTKETVNVFYKYVDPTTKEVSIRQSQKVELTKSLATLNSAWDATTDYSAPVDFSTVKKAGQNEIDWTNTGLENKGGILVKMGEYYAWFFNTTTVEATKMTDDAAAFEALRSLITWNTTNYNAEGTPAVIEGVSGRNINIAEVSVKFDDEAEAAKFITPTKYTADQLSDKKNTQTNEYMLESPVFTAKSDYEKTDLNDNQITLMATMTVVDAWGMKMEIPFEVTIKVNDK